MRDSKQPQRRPVLLVLTSTYPRWQGDPEPAFVHELARRLTERFEVIVLGPHAPGAARREVFDGVDVVRYRYAPRRLQTLVNDGGIVTNLRRSPWKISLVPSFVLGMLWSAWRVMRLRDIDVVHAHWLVPQGVVAGLLRWLPGRNVPFVITSHGADLYALRGKLFALLKRFAVARAEAVTVVSAPMLQELSAMGCDLKKISVRSMGVDLQGRFVPDSTVRRSSSEVLFVGRLVEKKGLRYLINAMPEVIKRRPDVRLIIAGFGPDEESLRARAKELDLNDSIRFVGAVEQSQLPSLYRRAAVLVAPFVRARSGDEEGLGLVIVEALGCCCPVVAGDVGAMTEIFGQTSGDFVVDVTNPQLLAERVLEVISKPGFTKARVVKLRRELQDRFDWQRVAIGYAELLERCVHAAPKQQ